MSDKAYRLPTSVRPRRYNIDITTSPARSDFHGKLEAELDVAEAVTVVEMHAKHLDLKDAIFAQNGSQQPARIVLEPAKDVVRFECGEALKPGPLTLQVTFAGRPSANMHGLYLAKDGADTAICTQCEATDARAIFPCFDEPEFKAALQWTIRTDGSNTALANGALVSTTDEAGLRVFRFEATKPVSSYLAAIAVGQFVGTIETRANGTPIRVWATNGKEQQAQFAHEFTEKLIPYFESYFGIQYPYGKYDQVAVPGFDAGAMENVGLVLFRQNLLLMDPDAASWNQEKLIAKVIAHELAHMWFGNLVTMAWWDDLWLNEAFAEWFAHKATHATNANYLVWNDFQSDKNRALINDALVTTHPIWAPVETPDEAIEMFDVITYQKGCAVMRMLENFLGDEDFQAGIKTYMKAFAESNARGADLWAHLATASGKDVGALMKSWIEQEGFPLVSLDLNGSTLLAEQTRFFSSPTDMSKGSDQVWNVPLIVRFEDDEGIKTARTILSKAREEIPLNAHGSIKWCYGNADEIGFYRVKHAPGVAAGLLEHGPQTLTAVEQMGLIEDQWALVTNAAQSLADFFPVLEAFSSSTDHNVVRALVDRLGTLDRVLEVADEHMARAAFRGRVNAIFEPQLESLGYEPKAGEAQSDLQRRALVIHAVASLAEVAEAIATSEQWAERERRDARTVDANLAGTFVGIAAKFGDAKRYDAWVATYAERKSQGAAPQDNLRYLYTLAAFRPEDLCHRTLGHLEDGVIPQEAAGAIIGQMLGTRHGQLAAWHYLTANWEQFRARVGDMGISRVVEATGHLPGQKRQELVQFFEQNPPAGAERALSRALEAMDQREALYERITPQLTKLLD